jgi:hypothetical protein
VTDFSEDVCTEPGVDPAAPASLCDGTWLRDEDAVVVIPGHKEPFRHADRHTLHRLGEPTPNPLLAVNAS